SLLRLLCASHLLLWPSIAVLPVYMPFHFVSVPIPVPANVVLLLLALCHSISSKEYLIVLVLFQLHISLVPYPRFGSFVPAVVDFQFLFSTLSDFHQAVCRFFHHIQKFHHLTAEYVLVYLTTCNYRHPL